MPAAVFDADAFFLVFEVVLAPALLGAASRRPADSLVRAIAFHSSAETSVIVALAITRSVALCSMTIRANSGSRPVRASSVRSCSGR